MMAGEVQEPFNLSLLVIFATLLIILLISRLYMSPIQLYNHLFPGLAFVFLDSLILLKIAAYMFGPRVEI